MKKRNLLESSGFVKLDISVAIATTAIGLEFLPSYLGLNLGGLTLAWLVLPPVLIVSLIKNHRNYFSPQVLSWLVIFLVPMLCYALIVDWNEDIPFMTVPHVLRAFSLSLVILLFYIVHGRTPEGRRTFMAVMVFVGFIAAFINIGSLLGLSEKGREVAHLGGKVYVVRISPMGDPNITTIYLIGLAISLPYWRKMSAKYGTLFGLFSFFLVIFSMLGSASRGGFLSVFAAFMVILYYSLDLKKFIVLNLFLLFSLGIPLLIMGTEQITLPQYFDTFLVRFRLLAERGFGEETFSPRIAAVKWFLKDFFTSPNLFGIGFAEYSVEALIEGAEWLPHNSFIDMYVLFGVIGFIPYVLLWVKAILSYMKCSRDHDENEENYGIWGLAFGAGLAVLLLSVSIVVTKIIWAYLGIGLALSFQYKQRGQNSKKRAFL